MHFKHAMNILHRFASRPIWSELLTWIRTKSTIQNRKTKNPFSILISIFQPARFDYICTLYIYIFYCSCTHFNIHSIYANQPYHSFLIYCMLWNILTNMSFKLFLQQKNTSHLHAYHIDNQLLFTFYIEHFNSTRTRKQNVCTQYLHVREFNVPDKKMDVRVQHCFIVVTTIDVKQLVKHKARKIFENRVRIIRSFT